MSQPIEKGYIPTNPQNYTQLAATWEEFLLIHRGPPTHYIDIIEGGNYHPYYRQRAMGELLNPGNIDHPLLGDQKIDWGEFIVSHKLSDSAADALLKLFTPGSVSSPEYKKSSKVDTYNSIVRALLPHLEDEKAETLFSIYSIDRLKEEHRSSSDYDKPSVYKTDYTPLEELYMDPNVSIVWKRKAAEKIHGVITAESDRARLLNESPSWLGVAGRYSDIMDSLLRKHIRAEAKKRLPVSSKFFEEEIAFLLDTAVASGFERAYNILYIDGERMVAALELIKDKDIRHRFIRHQVLITRRFEAFGVATSTDNRQAAYTILKEFPEDTELTEILQAQLERYEEHLYPGRKEEETRAKREQELRSMMKK